MPYTRPFFTRFLVSYAGDSSQRRLALAVRPIDTFTGMPVTAPVRVKLKELPDARAVRNESGFFCFEGREDENGNEIIYKAGDYTLIAEPDRVVADWFFLEPVPGQPWSFEFTRKITLPMGTPKNPVEPIRWSPNPSYPFPYNSTLVRGTVKQGGGPLAGVVVSTTYKQTDPQDTSVTKDHLIETQSDEKGEFVLFFQALPPATPLPPATQKILLTAVKNGQQIQQQANIMEGTATNEVVVFP
jgi:hypothetical protein